MDCVADRRSGHGILSVMRSVLVSIGLWILAVVITVGLAGYQRRTGPSYPLRGSVETAGGSIGYALPRSHGGEGGLEVTVDVAGKAVHGGRIVWRRYPTAEPWQDLPLEWTEDGRLRGVVPHQPPAGKVEYRVVLETDEGQISLPPDETVVARFRGGVPPWILVPHILCMFLGMLLATRGMLEVLFRGRDRGRGLVLGATALLVLGGLVLGPLVQLHAFGALWTGWPFGGDLTDNKTLIAILCWLPAVVAAWRRRQHPALLAAGWAVMMAVFLIPHSMRGSELDWSTVPEAHRSGQPDGTLQEAPIADPGGRGSLDEHVAPERDVPSKGDVTPHPEAPAVEE